MTIEERIENFKIDLQNESMSDTEIVQKHIISGSSFIFDDDTYFELKKTVADKFRVHIDYVKMIGSAKLGFSIAPRKLWKHFDDESDIDVVIISEAIFDEFWIDLHDFNIRTTSRSDEEEKRFYKFLEYFFRGWIRPDYFSFKYRKKWEWFKYFNSISYATFGERKIVGAIFRNYHFFESYHIRNINRIRIGVTR